MTTHTPGPWIQSTYDYGYIVSGPDGYAICSVADIPRSDAINLANAELITMAPDLLFRLALLVDAWRRLLRASADGEDLIVAISEVGTALGEAEALLDLLAESGVTVGEPS